MNVSTTRIFPVPLNCLRVFVLLLAVFYLSGTSQAELIYKFYGQIPSDLAPSAYTHPRIGPGETWVATLVVDETTSGVNWGYYTYDGAVKSGSLVFSGGYVSPIDFTPFQILVNSDGDRDHVQAAKYIVPGREYARMSVLSDSNPLSSSKMPGPGTKVVHNVIDDFPPSIVFSYRDSLGEFYYRGREGAINFAAYVPEPASLAIASLLCGLLVLARRRH